MAVMRRPVQGVVVGGVPPDGNRHEADKRSVAHVRRGIADVTSQAPSAFETLLAAEAIGEASEAPVAKVLSQRSTLGLLGFLPLVNLFFLVGFLFLTLL